MAEPPRGASTPLPTTVLSSSAQNNDGVAMPSYESKAVLQKTPKKLLQELEKRLLFAPALEMDAELAALTELQTSCAQFPEFTDYALKIGKLKNQIQANRQHLGTQLISKVHNF